PSRWKLRYSITPPTDDVVSVDLVGLVLDLDLCTEPPSTGPPTPWLTLIAAFQRGAKRELRYAVFGRRACLLDTIPRDRGRGRHPASASTDADTGPGTPTLGRASQEFRGSS